MAKLLYLLAIQTSITIEIGLHNKSEMKFQNWHNDIQIVGISGSWWELSPERFSEGSMVFIGWFV